MFYFDLISMEFLSFCLLKNLYCVATTEDVSIGKIMKFVSGTSSIPLLKLPRKLKVLFKHLTASVPII